MGEQRQQAPAAPRNWAEREAMIARAAYFRAEKRGFSGGNELEDWLLAEAEVDRLAGPQKGTPAPGAS